LLEQLDGCTSRTAFLFIKKVVFNPFFTYTITLTKGEYIMASRMFSTEQKMKLTQLVTEGIQVLQEVDDLNAGLNDTIKAVAKELELKPMLLKKAIKIAQKSKFGDANADHETLTDILETVGRTL
jgi:transposase-like protein